jgi:hypothetical protein
MMNPLIILIALLVVPLVVLMALRINAAIVFLSLCLGNVLVQFIGTDAGTLLSSTSARAPGVIPSSQSYVDLVLLLLPVILTMVIMIHTVQGPKLAFNILPAIGVSVLGVLLAVPLLSAGLTGAITGLTLWHKLVALQSLVLSVTTLLCLLFLWMQRPKTHKDEGKHHAKV